MGAQSVRCECCGGAGVVPLKPHLQETLDLVRSGYRTSSVLHLALGGKTSIPALCGRLNVLRTMGLLRRYPQVQASGGREWGYEDDDPANEKIEAGWMQYARSVGLVAGQGLEEQAQVLAAEHESVRLLFAHRMVERFRLALRYSETIVAELVRASGSDEGLPQDDPLWTPDAAEALRKQAPCSRRTDGEL